MHLPNPGRRGQKLMAAALLGAFAFSSNAAAAGSFSDPVGDYLPSYTGPLAGDLDILSGSARFSESHLLLTSTMNGAVGGAVGSLFLWGVDRGSGFPALITGGPPAVGPVTILMDAVVRLNSDGTGALLTFPAMGAPTVTVLDPSLIDISGSVLRARIPRDLLFSTGFDFVDYTYIHWSRSAFGSQDFIADLAPDDSSFRATAVPEPGTWAMLLAGFGALGTAARRRRHAQREGLA